MPATPPAAPALPFSRGKRAALLGASLLALLALPAGCSSMRLNPDDPNSRAIQEFRATHVECNPEFFRKPCQIGPDGKLYEYLPGEKDR